MVVSCYAATNDALASRRIGKATKRPCTIPGHVATAATLREAAPSNHPCPIIVKAYLVGSCRPRGESRSPVSTPAIAAGSRSNESEAGRSGGRLPPKRSGGRLSLMSMPLCRPRRTKLATRIPAIKLITVPKLLTLSLLRFEIINATIGGI